MKGGSAGAIILVGLGVLFLNLAYTGRGAAVWAALRGDGANPAAEAPADTAADSGDEAANGNAEDGGGGGGGRGFDKKPAPTDQPAAGAGSAWRTVRIN